MKKERILIGTFGKLKARADGPFHISKKINDNAYKIDMYGDLLGDYNIYATFNMTDLTPYDKEPFLVDSLPILSSRLIPQKSSSRKLPFSGSQRVAARYFIASSDSLLTQAVATVGVPSRLLLAGDHGGTHLLNNSVKTPFSHSARVSPTAFLRILCVAPSLHAFNFRSSCPVSTPGTVS